MSESYRDKNSNQILYMETANIFDSRLFLWIFKIQQPQWLACKEDEIDMEEAQWLQRISFGLQRNGGKLVQAWRVTCKLVCKLDDWEHHIEWKSFHFFLFQVPDEREVEMIV